MSDLLTRQILDEAIGAEDLNKVHLMEGAIASNATLQGSFTQIERLGYRLLDWGDFRVYRVHGSQISLVFAARWATQSWGAAFEWRPSTAVLENSGGADGPG